MRNDFSLENGIYCKGVTDDFKLYYDKKELTPSCHKISYIPNTLIAVKSKRRIHIYKPIINFCGDNVMLYKVAMFESYDYYANIKVISNNKLYIVDSNANIILCETNIMY